MRKREWFLVYTKPRTESIGVTNLRNQGYEVFFPQIILDKPGVSEEKLQIEPMFPRYLFVKLNKTKDNWTPIRSTTGISHIVTFGQEPAVVPMSLVSYMIQSSDNHGVLTQKREIKKYTMGDKVTIQSGVFQGQDAKFFSYNGRERVLVLLEFLGQESITRIPLENI